MTVGFKCMAEISGVSTLADGGMSLRLKTGEIASAEQKLMMLESVNHYGSVLFVGQGFAKEEVPEIKSDENKSPSQRLRGALYRYWERTKKDKGVTFDAFYRQKMENLIEMVKQQLELNR